MQALKRHENTTKIKNNVILAMFKAKYLDNKKIKSLAYDIIDELNMLQTIKITEFATKYSIQDINDIKLAIKYCKDKTDGGQIQNWCCYFKKILSAS